MSVGTLARDLHNPAANRRPVIRAVARPTALVVALTAVAALLRFYRLGHQGFWFDEGNTAFLMHFTPGQMLGLIPSRESTPPLYYCVAWVWSHVFGSGEVGLRSLSALAGVATVPTMYLAGAKLMTPRAGVTVAALAAFNPFLIWYSQEARSYSLLVLLGAASVAALAYALERPTPRRLGIWVLAGALALGTHYYAALAVVPEAVWLALVHRRERSTKFALVAVGACALALIPLAISQNGTGNSSWIGPIPIGVRLGQIPRQLLIGTGAPAATLLFGLGLVAFGLSLVLLARVAGEPERRGARVAAGILAGGALLNALLIVGGSDDLITRNVIILWVPLALVVAAGLGAGRAGWLGIAGAATLCAIGAVGAIGVATNRNLQRPDWRLVARAIGPGPSPGARAGRMILLQHERAALPLSLYLHALKYVGHTSAVVDELDVVAISSPRVRACWWGAACNLISSQLSPTVPIRGFHITGPVLHVNQFSIMRLRSSQPVRLTPRAVARALTTTTLGRDGLLVQRSGVATAPQPR